MMELTAKNIRLHARVASKEEAIRESGRLLVELGYIDPAYIESVFCRERQGSTYLGNGIAIPHGLQQDRLLIHRTGLSVVQVPLGVEWDPGQIVYIIIGIAAKSDEHLGILTVLAEVFDDSVAASRLARTNDAAEIICSLTPRFVSRAVMDEQVGMEVTIPGEIGLHARPATIFAQTALTFVSEVKVWFRGKCANGKVMLSLLKLGVPGEATIRIFADGADAAAALQTLRTVVEQGFFESEENNPPLLNGRHWMPASSNRAITGISASDGLAIGPVIHYRPLQLVVADHPQDAATEKKVFCHAVSEATSQLQQHSGKTEAAIFCAHLAFLNDRELFHEVFCDIDKGHSAAWSWQQIIARRVAEFSQIENERLSARAADLNDVGQRVLHLLVGQEPGEIPLPKDPSILVANDLSPSETACLDPKRIVAICTVSGSPTTHAAIIARSLNIPTIVGIDRAVLELVPGTVCIADASAGKFYSEPSERDLESACRFRKNLKNHWSEEYCVRYQPAVLMDGHRVKVVANIGKTNEAAAAVETGAEGVGLMRTEFLFLNRGVSPSEDEQYEAYTTMIRALNGLPLILRTLDIGGDKIASYIPMPREENPFLGMRGIRLCLQQPEIFLPQLRAIYRASFVGPVHILFPMVATLEDLRAAKKLAETVRRQLGAPTVEFGIMIEVPSAVFLATELAREVDFFSIGTNDLTQYTLATDRLHAALAKNVDGLHPAVLRMIDMTVRAAQAEGKWVGVCGDIAGDPLGVAILSGLGVAELSMSLPSIATIKARLRKLRLADVESLARRALACSTLTEVRQLVAF